MTNYVCGTCGARFRTDREPKGCPVCWSDKITVTSRKLSEQERIKYTLEVAKKEAEILNDLHEQARPHRKAYTEAYRYLYSKIKRGFLTIEDIPKVTRS